MAFTAAFAEGETPTVTAYKADAPITVDGDLSEWTLDSPIVIDQESQVIRDLSFWQGASDLSCTVYVMYDETNLYLAVDVTEDTPFGAIEMLPLDGEDNFKIYISTDPAADPGPHRIWHQRFLLYSSWTTTTGTPPLTAA